MSKGQTDESAIQRYVTAGEGSVARCFVKDVLALKDAKIGGQLICVEQLAIVLNYI